MAGKKPAEKKPAKKTTKSDKKGKKKKAVESYKIYIYKMDPIEKFSETKTAHVM